MEDDKMKNPMVNLFYGQSLTEGFNNGKYYYFVTFYIHKYSYSA